MTERFRMPLDHDWGGTRTADLPHTVYAHLDDQGIPLYVGCTARLEQRTATHRSSAEWWSKVAEIRVIGTWTRELALAVERGVIERFQPPHNYVFTEQWSEWFESRRGESPPVTTGPRGSRS